MLEWDRKGMPVKKCRFVVPYLFLLPLACLDAADVERTSAEIAAAIKQERDYDRRREAAWALGRLGIQALPEARALLKDSDWHARLAGCESIRTMGLAGKEAAPDLIALLKDADEDVREKAADALGSMGAGAKDAIDPLIELFRDKEESVVDSAGQALAKIGVAARPRLFPLLKNPKDKAMCLGAIDAIRRVLPVDRPALDELIRLLTNQDEDIRSKAMSAMGEIGPDAAEAVPHLIRALQREVKLKWLVAYTLGGIGHKAREATPFLRALLEDRDEDVQFFAANALRAIFGESGWEPPKPEPARASIVPSSQSKDE